MNASFILRCSFAALLAFGLQSLTHGQSEIEVFSELGDSFTMYLNQVQINETPAPRVLTQVDAGYYQLRIDFAEAGRPDILKNNFGVEAGMRSTGKITMNRKGEWVVRPFAYVSLAEAAPAISNSGSYGGGTTTASPAGTNVGSPSESIDLSMNVSGMGQPQTTTPTESMQMTMNVSGTSQPQNATQTESVQMTMNVGGGLIPGGMNMNVNVTSTGTMDVGGESWESGSSTISTSTSTVTTTSGAQNVTSASSSSAVMTDLDFNDYLAAINAKTFEDSKLSTAKAPLNSGVMLSAGQIAQVMRAFTYESSRVDFAIFAHPRCADQHNYYKTHGAFDFELSIDELNDAIGN